MDTARLRVRGWPSGNDFARFRSSFKADGEPSTEVGRVACSPSRDWCSRHTSSRSSVSVGSLTSFLHSRLSRCSSRQARREHSCPGTRRRLGPGRVGIGYLDCQRVGLESGFCCSPRDRPRGLTWPATSAHRHTSSSCPIFHS